MKEYPSFDGVYVFMVWQFLDSLLRINLYKKAYSYKRAIIFDLMALKCGRSDLMFLSACYYKRVGLDCNIKHSRGKKTDDSRLTDRRAGRNYPVNSLSSHGGSAALRGAGD